MAMAMAMAGSPHDPMLHGAGAHIPPSYQAVMRAFKGLSNEDLQRILSGSPAYQPLPIPTNGPSNQFHNGRYTPTVKTNDRPDMTMHNVQRQLPNFAPPLHHRDTDRRDGSSMVTSRSSSLASMKCIYATNDEQQWFLFNNDEALSPPHQRTPSQTSIT
jgi:hypothetical protein